MRQYNSGWCTYCNGNFCPCNCGCGSCSCSCGRKTVIQQSKSSCCNTTAGTRFCKEPTVYVTGNFVVPAANVEVEVTISDSVKVYLGQGIQIGEGYFQITEIVDSRTIKITHNGSAVPNTTITAVNPTYGCYSYPIYFVGLVERGYEVDEGDIEGLDSNYELVADAIIDPVLSYTYGYVGPEKVQFNLELICEIDNTPEFISLPLPAAGNDPTAVFSAYIVISGVPTILVAFKDADKLIVGYGGGTNFTDGADRSIYVSGEYGV